MERPDIGKPAFKPEMQMRLVARTQSIEEANRIAEQCESEGCETQVIKKRQGILAIYEVWASKSETRA
jgi:hypothetical protein